jgi:LPS export ABC transporter protein LptC
VRRAPSLAAAGPAAALAAALAACKSERSPTVVDASALPDTAEQVMFRLRHQLTSGGVRRANLVADTAYFYDDGNRIEMRRVRLVFFSATGDSSSVLTSRTGRYDVRLQRVEGRGDVVVTTTEGKRLTSPQLVYDRVLNQITSDTSFVFTEPGRTLTGIGLRTDPKLTTVQVLRNFGGRTRVNATELPRPTAPVPGPPPAGAPPAGAPPAGAPPAGAPPAGAPPAGAPPPPAARPPGAVTGATPNVPPP